MLQRTNASCAAAAVNSVLAAAGRAPASRGHCGSTEFDNLISSDVLSMDEFGGAVFVSSAVAVVGSRLHDGGHNAGSAYVFEFDGRTWIQVAKLASSDVLAYDNFGISVAIDGAVALVGATLRGPTNRGEAYVSCKPQNGWSDTTETAKLTASDAAEQDRFATATAKCCTTGGEPQKTFAPASGKSYSHRRSQKRQPRRFIWS